VIYESESIVATADDIRRRKDYYINRRGFIFTCFLFSKCALLKTPLDDESISE